MTGVASLSTETMAGKYSAGATLRDIAAEAGVTHVAVHHRLQRAGVEMRRGGRHDGRLTGLAKEVLSDLGEFPAGASLSDLLDWLGEDEDRTLRAMTRLLRLGLVAIVPRPA